MQLVRTILLFSLLFTVSHTFSQFIGQTELSDAGWSMTATSLLSMDYDQDGDLDIIAGGGSRIRVYKNLGAGSFDHGQIVTSAVINLQSIFASDLDGDGDEDLLSASTNDNKIAWYKNQGGFFSPQIVITTSATSAYGVHAADLDGDGDMDVLSASNDKIAWYENLGGGIFGPQQIITSLVSQAKRVRTLDIDEDGDLDVISASQGDTKIAWYENMGSGVFGLQQIISAILPNSGEFILSDVDGDGDHDLLLACGTVDKIIWFENLNSGAFGAQQVISNTPFNVSSIYADDLDNDGDMDVIASLTSPAEKIVFYENIGGGIFGPEQIVTNFTENPNHVFSTDLDGDGYSDIMVGAVFYDIAWHKNNQDLTFAPELLITVATMGAAGMFPSDLDNDGDIDMVVASEWDNQVAWFENFGGGDMHLLHDVSENAMDCWSVFSIDLNGDNFNDIISASPTDNKIAWYINQGNGLFSAEQILTTSLDGANSVVSFDVDGDNDNDIVAGGVLGGEIVWFSNDGFGNFGSAQLITSLAVGLRDLAFADLDNNGTIDLVSVSSTGAKIAWYPNMSGGIFSSQQIIATISGSPRGVDVGDLNGDGAHDIVVASFTGDKLLWYENLGSGNFGTQQIIATLSLPISVFVGDLDNDMDLDIVSCTHYADQVYWFENQGTGTFITHLILWTNFSEPRFVSGADMDADNDLDIFVSSLTDHTVAYITNHLNAPFTLTGNVFYDNDQNGAQDPDDFGLPNIKVVTSPGVSFSTTDTLGNYKLYLQNVLFTQYTVNPINYPGWTITSDSLQYHVNITTTNTFKDSLYFGLFPDSLFNNCSSDITSNTPLCGETITYWLTACNNGTLKHSGLFELILDTNLTFISSTISPDSIAGSSLYWHYDSLSYFDCISIPVVVEIPAIPSVDTVTNVFNIFSLDGFGNTTFLSADTLSQILDCLSPLTANYKSVLPKGIDSMGYIPDTTAYLEYTIYFQNNTSDTIHSLLINDQLDSALDWQSCVVTSSSHPFVIYCNSAGELTFMSEALSLPPYSTNTNLSKGFITFKIDINPGLPSPTVINNYGQIKFLYDTFGYNLVNTNTTVNTIYNCLDVMQNVTMESIGCENQFITGGLPDSETTSSFIWEIIGVDTLYGETFNWLPDSSGIFNLEISIENGFCLADTILQITIYELIPLQFLDSTIICSGESTLIFGNSQFVQAIYYDTLIAVNGCDSILAKQLVVLPPTPISNLGIIEICYGTNEIIFGQSQSVSGTYYDTLQTINGCDSILSLDLVVLPPIPNTDLSIIDICAGDSTIIFGLYQSLNGIYYDTLINVNGCDSIIYKQLNLISPSVDFGPLLEDTVCTYSMPIILNTGVPSGGIYYGPGVSGGEFDPTAAVLGNHFIYYEYEDLNGCKAIDSIEIFVDGCLGQNEFFTSSIIIYPNPTQGILTLENLPENGTIKVFNTLGELVFFKEISVEEKSIDLTSLSNGFYLLEVSSESENYRTTIIKN